MEIAQSETVVGFAVIAKSKIQLIVCGVSLAGIQSDGQNVLKEQLGVSITK